MVSAIPIAMQEGAPDERCPAVDALTDKKEVT
jgi:hypothetical protein